MRNFTLLLFWVITVLADGQNINGVVIDERQEPVAFASISLLMANDSIFVQGAITDAEGRFDIVADSAKKILKVSCLGYTTKYLQPSQNMKIVLEPDTMTIGNVVITGRRPIIKMKGGALIAPVENTVLSKLGDAKDVLAQLPLLDYKRGKYSVIGKENTIIYINNRLMRDPQELQSITSNSIKDVIIDLSPDARYAADVDAVIKITTLRPVGEGLGGNFVSRYDRNNVNRFYENVKLNYRHHGLDLFFHGTGINQSRKEEQNSKFAFQFDNKPIFTCTDDSFDNNYYYLNLTGGFNYDISKREMIGIRYEFSKVFPNTFYTTSQGIYQQGNDTLNYRGQKNVKYYNRGDHQINAFYRNEISTKWQITIDATYVKKDNSSNGDQKEENGSKVSEVSYNSISSSRLWALKGWSYNQWLNGTAIWGFESFYIRNNQNYKMLNEEVAQYIPTTESLSREQSYSLFFNYDRSFGTLLASLGLRYEHVDYNFEINKQHDDDASRNYNIFLPSFSLAYSKEHTSIRLGYRTIISRPSYYKLRGEIEYSSSFNADSGNPRLRPTYNHSLSLFIQHQNLVLDATYNHQVDASLYLSNLIPAHPIALGTYINHDIESYHANLIYSPTIGIWKPSFMAGVEGQILSNDGSNYSGVGLNLQWKNIVSLPRQWTITFNINGNSAKWIHFMHMKPELSANISVKKSIGNWLLTAGANDIFNTLRERWTRDTYGVQFEKRLNNHEHGFYVRVQYSFNPAKSKYKGGQAGQSELNRL